MKKVTFPAIALTLATLATAPAYGAETNQQINKSINTAPFISNAKGFVNLKVIEFISIKIWDIKNEQFTITMEMSLVDDLQLDSLDMYELIKAIEEKFKIQLNDESIATLVVTVGDLVEYVSVIVANKE